MNEQEPLIPKHGGYRKLKSLQVAQLVYDVTVRFCGRYISSRSRTHDQMVQAARSGVQNIAEGSQASGTSRKIEMKLTGIARASLEELRLDYEDFLRQSGLALWDKFDARLGNLIASRPKTAEEVASWVESVHGGFEANGRDGQDGRDGRVDLDKTHDPNEQRKAQPQSDPTLKSKTRYPSKSSMQSIPSIESIPSIRSISSTYPEIAANGALALITVACSLLDRQLSAQSKIFETEGGFTERLHRVRSSSRRLGR